MVQKIVYHGTDKTFDKFEKKFLGSTSGTSPINITGFSFTDSIRVAKSFGKRIITASINISNPYVIDAKGQTYSEFKDKLNDVSERAVNKNYNGIIIKNYRDAGKYSKHYFLSNHYIPFNTSQIKIINIELV